MKKILATVLTLAMLFSFMAVPAFAANSNVAKIVSTGVEYASLADALAAAQDGDTVELISGPDVVISAAGAVYGKTVTITGTANFDWSKGWLFVGRGGVGDGKIIFDNATITADNNSLTASTGIHISAAEINETTKNNGEVIIRNSNIQVSYIACRNNLTIDNSTVFVNRVFWVGGRAANETPDGVAGVAAANIINNSFVTVGDDEGMGIGWESKGILNIENSSFETTASSFSIHAGSEVSIKDSVFTAPTLKTAANISASGEVTINAPVFSDATKNVIAAAGTAVIGSDIGGILSAQGDITFEGANKAIKLSPSANSVITIGKGASFVHTGTERMVLGHGNTFNIEGNISDAKTTDVATVTPSLVLPKGASVTGSGITFNVTDAYVSLASTTSKPGAATNTFNFNIVNSIIDATHNFCLYTPTGAADPTFNAIFEDSVLNVATNLVFAATKSNVTFDNTKVTVGSAMRNDGKLDIINGSDLLVKDMIQATSGNAGNSGTLTVDNSKIDIMCLSAGHALDGLNTGKVIIKNNADAKIDYLKNSALALDGTSKFTATDIIDVTPIEIDAANAVAGKVIDLNSTKDKTEGKVTITGNTDPNMVAKYGDDGDVQILFNVAELNSVKYTSLRDALNDAADGDEIILLSDLNDVDLTIAKDITLNLNGYTLNDAYIKTKGNVEIKNGDIKNVAESYPLVVENGTLTVNDVDIEASKSDRAIWVRSGNLVFNSGSILATKGAGNTTSMNITAIYTAENTNVTINGGTITVDTPNNKAIAIYGNYANSNVTVNGGKISTSGANYSYGINVNGDVTVTGGEIVTNEKGYTTSNTKGITNGNNYAIVVGEDSRTKDTGDITITGGKITTNGYNGYMINASGANQTIAISDVEFANKLSETDITVGGHKAPALIKADASYSPSSNADIDIKSGTFNGISEKMLSGDNTGTLAISGGSYDADPSAYVVPGLAAAVGSNGKFAIIPDSELPETLEVKFVKTENKGVYDIVVEGDAFVNELSTVALTFVNESENNDRTAMGYSITGVAPYNYLVEGDKYTFYATSGAAMTDDTLFVKVGQVKFAGYGEIDFEVLATADNRAIIKTAKDNAEYIYAKLGTLDAVGELVIDTDAVINEEIAPEMADLTIEVDYVHDVKENDFDYQQMTIEITGLDLLDGPIYYYLGDDGVYAPCDKFTSESNVAHTKHTVVVSDKLIEGNSYTVKVYGDGYRTAEYTIRMENDKTLKFWNNVMTNKTYMEEDDLEGTQVNFLAGDILPDEIINVYDLSAVVSYFGENPKANASYIQYDLNRDGKIDGLDISILLNSWGK